MSDGAPRVAVAEIVYPPERSSTIECAQCNGKGARSAVAGHCFDIDGGLWHEPGECKSCGPSQSTCCPPCRNCAGSGQVPRKHYAYCKRVWCVGCLPTIAEVSTMHFLDAAGEMLARCIAQTPETKTVAGAVRAIAENRSEYESVAYFARRHNLLAVAVEPVAEAVVRALIGLAGGNDA